MILCVDDDSSLAPVCGSNYYTTKNFPDQRNGRYRKTGSSHHVPFFLHHDGFASRRTSLVLSYFFCSKRFLIAHISLIPAHRTTATTKTTLAKKHFLALWAEEETRQTDISTKNIYYYEDQSTKILECNRIKKFKERPPPPPPQFSVLTRRTQAATTHFP